MLLLVVTVAELRHTRRLMSACEVECVAVCESVCALVRASRETKSNTVVISTNALGMYCNPLNLLLSLLSNRKGSKVRAIVSLTRGCDI